MMNSICILALRHWDPDEPVVKTLLQLTWRDLLIPTLYVVVAVFFVFLSHLVVVFCRSAAMTFDSYQTKRNAKAQAKVDAEARKKEEEDLARSPTRAEYLKLLDGERRQ